MLLPDLSKTKLLMVKMSLRTIMSMTFRKKVAMRLSLEIMHISGKRTIILTFRKAPNQKQ